MNKTEDQWIIKPNDSGIRPAGKKDHCFYCNQTIGQVHKPECVVRTKTVVMNFTVEVINTVPEHWDEAMINFHYNVSTWCADNLIERLAGFMNEETCLCRSVTAKYTREATEQDEQMILRLKV